MEIYWKLNNQKTAFYTSIISIIIISSLVSIIISDKIKLAGKKTADSSEKTQQLSNSHLRSKDLFRTSNSTVIGQFLEQVSTNNEIPEAWEKPLMDILLNSITPEDRVENLYEMATRTALGFPRVQEECLNHLIYTIPDQQYNIFYKILTNNNIPLQQREVFLEKILTMRPDELCIPLCESLRNSENYRVTEICNKYLQDYENSTKAEIGAAGLRK